MKENGDLRAQLVARNSALADAQAELLSKDVEIAELSRGAEYQAPLAQVTGFEQIPNVSAEFGNGQLTVAVESDVLFASGKSMLKGPSKASLDQVAAVLTSRYGRQIIRVEGHTDSDPIRKSGFKSNYHLGFERAFAVREYLVTRGIAPDRISLASHGPDQPLTSKPKSRRVEIVVFSE